MNMLVNRSYPPLSVFAHSKAHGYTWTTSKYLDIRKRELGLHFVYAIQQINHHI